MSTDIRARASVARPLQACCESVPRRDEEHVQAEEETPRQRHDEVDKTDADDGGVSRMQALVLAPGPLQLHVQLPLAVKVPGTPAPRRRTAVGRWRLAGASWPLGKLRWCLLDKCRMSERCNVSGMSPRAPRLPTKSAPRGCHGGAA